MVALQLAASLSMRREYITRLIRCAGAAGTA